MCGLHIYNLGDTFDPIEVHLEFAPKCMFAQLASHNPKVLEEPENIPAVRAASEFCPQDQVMNAYRCAWNRKKGEPTAAEVLDHIFACSLCTKTKVDNPDYSNCSLENWDYSDDDIDYTKTIKLREGK